MLAKEEEAKAIAADNDDTDRIDSPSPAMSFIAGQNSSGAIPTAKEKSQGLLQLEKT